MRPRRHVPDSAFDLISSVRALLVALEVPHDDDAVRRTLTTHPEFPALVSVLETLDGQGLDVDVEHVDPEGTIDLSTPCLAHVRAGDRDGLLAVASGRGSLVRCWLGLDGWVELQAAEFRGIWTGVLVVARRAAPSGFAAEVRRPDRSTRAVWSAVALALMLLAAVAPSPGAWTLHAVVASLLDVIGLLACIPMVALHLGVSDALGRWCRSDGRSSCASNLGSRWGAVLGVPVADLALVYFGGRLAWLGMAWMFGELDAAARAACWLDAAALVPACAGFVLQLVVTRRWCRLCLAVQLVLLLQFAATWGLAPGCRALEFGSVTGEFVALMLLCATAWWGVRRILAASVTNRAAEDLVLRQLRTPAFVRAALASTRPLPPPPCAGVLELGDPTAPMCVTVIATLECTACRLATIDLARLVTIHPDEVRGEVILLPDGAGSAPEVEAMRRAITARAVAGDHVRARALLASWFRGQRRVPDDVATQRAEEPLAWASWARVAGIRGTPTIAIDGRPLPLGSGIDAARALLFANPD